MQYFSRHPWTAVIQLPQAALNPIIRFPGRYPLPQKNLQARGDWQSRPHPAQVSRPRANIEKQPPTISGDADEHMSPSDGRIAVAQAESQPEAGCASSAHGLARNSCSEKEQSQELDPIVHAIRDGRGLTDSTATAAIPGKEDGRSTQQVGWMNVHGELGYEHEASWLAKIRHEVLHLTNKRFSRQTGVIVKFLDWLILVEEPKRDDPLGRFVEGPTFRWLCSCVILLNAWYVIYEANYEIQHLQTGPSDFMKVMEVIFFGFYALEILLKLVVHRAYFFVSGDCSWNFFDLILVLTSAVELVLTLLLWDGGAKKGALNFQFMRAYRLLKMSKIIRILRVVHFFSDIALMLNCILASLETLAGCLIMICFFLYFFSLFFVQMTTVYLNDVNLVISDEEKDRLLALFGSTQDTALTLFQSTTGGVDWKDVYTMLKPVGWAAQSAFIFYIAFFVVVAWNVITSTFMEKAARLAQPDVDSLMLDKHHQDVMDARHLSEVFSHLDSDHSGNISAAEFLAMTQDPTFLEFMQVRGIDIKDAKMFFNMLVSACRHDEVDISTFIGSCLRMKGLATSIDLHTLGFEVKTIHKRLSKFQAEDNDKIAKLQHLVAFTCHKLGALENLAHEIANQYYLNTERCAVTKHVEQRSSDTQKSSLS